MDTLGQRIREERERIGMSQAAFGAIAGVKKNAQINYEADRRSPDANYLVSILETGADAIYILTGRRELDEIKAISEQSGETSQIRRILAEVGPDAIMQQLIEEVGPDAVMKRLTTELFPHYEPPIENHNVAIADYAHIPLHEAVVSAGPGALNADSSIVDHLIFRADWLYRLGVSERNAAMARVCGDSMAPGIQPGDLILIDTSRTLIPIRQRVDGGDFRASIYAFVQDGEARVKRIDRPDARFLVLLSDNPNFPPELVTEGQPDSLNILGQVVWSGHVWR